MAWLKAANVGWLVYSGPRETYADYKTGSQKFDQVFILNEEKQGDKYYQVPLKNKSLAKAVPQVLANIKTPTNAIDKVPLFDYVTQMEASENTLSFKQIENGIYKITGNIGENEMVLVQLAYAPGWKATDKNGRTLKVSKDALSFILVKPVGSGEQNITLKYNTPIQVWLGNFVTVASIAVLLFLLVRFQNPLFDITNQKKKTDISE